MRQKTKRTFDILHIGHPVLRVKTNRIAVDKINHPMLRKFAAKMVRTMRHANGVGLAANQVGAEFQLAVLECVHNRRYPGRDNFPLEIYVNPKIVSYSKEKQWDWEGCLSIPDFRGLVPRSYSVVLEARTLNGEKLRTKLSGFHARVIQHEVDHLNGCFYIDRMPDLKNWAHVSEFNKQFRLKVKDAG